MLSPALSLLIVDVACLHLKTDQRFPEAPMAPDEHDELSLHLACRKAENVSLIGLLIDANLQAVNVAGDRGESSVQPTSDAPGDT